MFSIEYISSLKNPKLRQLLSLQEKSASRQQAGLFVVEGVKEVSRCLSAGFEADSFFYCPSIAGKTEEGIELLGNLPSSVRRFELSVEAYEKVAYRSGTEGIIGEFKQRTLSLSSLSLGRSPLLVVLESVEKPGNLGAVLRTADAAGVDALLVCDPLTDLFNPNLIRSSLGAAFTVPTVACTSQECIAFLKGRGVKIVTAQLQDSALYYDTDMTGPLALVFGTEHDGLSTQWRDASQDHVLIPMLGKVDSLNVSVSAAILLYEALRQRRSL